MNLDRGAPASLTIGELARRTGTSVETLRAWERRHGFPVPERLPGGHRRYSQRDVDAIREVFRARRDGTTLQAALAAQRDGRAGPGSSMFAVLRSLLSDVEPTVLTRPSMLAISRAIEDEAVVRGHGGVLLGAFQEQRFWRPTATRWRELAMTADRAVAMAASLPTRVTGRLTQVPLASSSPLRREWAVVCDSATFSACLVGIEQAGSTIRRFEALWSVEPMAVRAVARAATAAISEPTLRVALVEQLRAPAVASYDTLRSATRVTNRIVAHTERWALGSDRTPAPRADGAVGSRSRRQ